MSIAALFAFNAPLGRVIRLPLRLIPKTAVVPILSGKLIGKKWIVGASIAGCWLGTYERDKQTEFCKHLSAGDVVFDLGGHVGFYSLLSATLVGPTGRVIVFEPDPENVALIQKHISLNRFETIEVKQVAVSNKSGSLFFSAGEHSSMGKISDAGEVEVKAVVLDELFARGEIPLPDCIKMDIEGAEYDALCGAKTILVQAKPIIFLATHGDEISAKCQSFLTELGYTLSPLGDDGEEFLAQCL